MQRGKTDLEKVKEMIERSSLIINIDNRAKFGITDTALILGKTAKTIRRHTKEGKIKAGVSKVNNFPIYTGLAIKNYYNSQW